MRLAQAVENITLEMGRMGVHVGVPVPDIPSNKDKGIAIAVRLECIAEFLGWVNLVLNERAIAQQEAIKDSDVTLGAHTPGPVLTADVVNEPAPLPGRKVKK